MTTPFSFASRTPRLKLPNLFAGQSQREFTVNEAFALLDALLHAVVQGETNDPPAATADGECWIVGDMPSGDWTGQAGSLACREAGNWLFVQPVDGLTVLDRAAGKVARYDDGWRRADAVALPSGGAVEDVEARTAIGEIVSALQAAGILATP